MERDEAIAIIRKEYLCVDRDCGIEKNCGKCDLVMPSKEPILEAFKVAIKALEQEPCGDCISRKAAIDQTYIFSKDEFLRVTNPFYYLRKRIKSLPSVKPQYTDAEVQKMQELEQAEIEKAYELGKAEQQKAGRWIPVSEKLPEDGEEVLVWYEYLRYGEHGCMYQTYGIGYQYDGHWAGSVSGEKARCIAWMPLPAPFEPQESEGKA